MKWGVDLSQRSASSSGRSSEAGQGTPRRPRGTKLERLAAKLSEPPHAREAA